MRLGKTLPVLLMLGVASAGLTLADEVVHFTNGTYLTIRSHTVKDGMIHVVLGSDAEMAFPVSLVERVMAGGKEMSLTATGDSTPANQAVAGTEPVDGDDRAVNTRAYPVTGAGSAARGPARSNSARRRALLADDPEMLLQYASQPDEGEVESNVVRPFSNSANPNKRKISITGDRSLHEGIQTNQPTRNRTLDPGGGASRRFTPLEFRPKPGVATPPPAKSDKSGSGEKSSSGE